MEYLASVSSALNELHRHISEALGRSLVLMIGTSNHHLSWLSGEIANSAYPFYPKQPRQLPTPKACALKCGRSAEPPPSRPPLLAQARPPTMVAFFLLSSRQQPVNSRLLDTPFNYALPRASGWSTIAIATPTHVRSSVVSSRIQ
jgi:hypothetical protein